MSPIPSLSVKLIIRTLGLSLLGTLFIISGGTASAKNYHFNDGDTANIPVTTSTAPSTKLPTPSKNTTKNPGKSNPACSDNQIDLKLLIISLDGNEPALYTIQQTLDSIGVPYTVWKVFPTGFNASDQSNKATLTASMLSSSCHGFYQGVIFTNNTSAEGYLTADEETALQNYEATFSIRRVCWYSYPTTYYEYGFQNYTTYDDPTAAPTSATLTKAGASVFSYLQPKATISIQNVYRFYAKPADKTIDANLVSATPLLTDSQGDALALAATFANGRQTLSFAFDGNPSMTHSLALAYGAINWVSQGLFLGQHRNSIDVEVDDLFLPNALWDGTTYRITGDDLKALKKWQNSKQRDSQLSNLTLELALNGVGTTSGYASPDTLTPAASSINVFNYYSHTWDHGNMGTADYPTALSELQQNIALVKSLKINPYLKNCFVPPGYTGLGLAENSEAAENPNFLKAAYDVGIRYMVTDASDPTNLSLPINAGKYSQSQPDIFFIPRHPAGLPLSASNPDQLIGYTYDTTGQTLSYSAITDSMSSLMAQFLIKGDWDPWMYHQANLRAYDGVHSLIGDLLDQTTAKYEALFSLPLESLSMADASERMKEKMSWTSAGVTATLYKGKKIILTATKDTVVPITGLNKGRADVYGGQYISRVTLKAGQSVTVNYP